MNRVASLAAAGALVLGLYALPASAQSNCRVAFSGGLVSVTAVNVPLRQVLIEWQRAGGTRFVNLDRLPSLPVSIDVQQVPEAQALAILLRPLGGYMASPRATTSAAGPSGLAVVVIVPSLAPLMPERQAATPLPANPNPASPGYRSRMGMPPNSFNPNDVDRPDEMDPADPDMMGMGRPPDMPGTGGMRFSIPAPGRQPQDPNPMIDPAAGQPPPAGPAGRPLAPTGSAVPGTIVPAPKAPGAVPKPPGDAHQ